jgi:hypothetical protein
VVPLNSGECLAAPGTPPGSYPRPAVRARMIACARSETCNLVKMLEMWLRTVLGASASRAAIAALFCPAATMDRTSRSRSVSSGRARMRAVR